MSRPVDFEHLDLPQRADWRAWLQANHDTAPGVWLVYAKKGSGLSSVGYDEAVEEALCFGWIDSKVNRVDDQRFKQIYTPRKPGSIWSRLNKERVERAIGAGLMTEAGLTKIRAAQADGSWATLDEIDAMVMPEDLRSALDADSTAAENFEAFPASKKKQFLYWIASAKRPATRDKRIAETVQRARDNNSLGE